MEDVGQRVVMDVRDQLYGHILGQSASFFGRNAVGQLLSRVSNDVGQVQRAVSETAGDLRAKRSRSSATPSSCSISTRGWRSCA